MAKAGVIGWPVNHSLSPKLHRYWLDKYKIKGEYRALAVAPKELERTLQSLPGEGYAGFNVTLPHKEAASLLVDELDDAARAIGAVNTVVIKGKSFLGKNTDAYGFAQSLKAGGGLKHKKKAVVLGAGGAARAVVKALADEGFAHIVIACRTMRKGLEIRDSKIGKEKNIEVVTWAERHAALEHADLLVNATSLNLAGGEALDIDLGLLPKAAAVMDLVYVPLVTPLLAQAKKRGNITIDGLGMLMHQAVPAFEAWFGVRPEVDEALKALLVHE